MFKIGKSQEPHLLWVKDPGLGHWNFGHSDLFRISIFEFRIFLLPEDIMELTL
jgi:hypothetical protein